MTVEAEDIAVAAGDHVVQFYGRDRELVAGVLRFLIGAHAAGAVTLVLATPAHRRAFEAEAAGRGLDLPATAGRGDLVWLDATELAGELLVDGRIDAEVFDRRIGRPVRALAAGGRPIRAFGEVVGVLWEAGEVPAAIDLETRWNDLTAEVPLALYCAYPGGPDAEPDSPDRRHVCGLHSGMLPPTVSDRPQTADLADGTTEVTCHFAGGLHSPGEARRFGVAALHEWGVGHLATDAAVVLAELAANAVLHARSAFTVAVRMSGGAVRIAVHDANRVVPVRRPDGTVAESGRGLGLVSRLAARWGTDLTAEGKVVWAELRP